MNTALVAAGDALDRVLAGVDSRYRYPARAFVRFLRAEGLRIDDPASWVAYQESLGDFSASTQNTYIAAAKAAIRYALAAHAAASDITAEQYRFYEDRIKDTFKAKKRPEPSQYIPSKVMTKEQIDRLVMSAGTEGWGCPGRRRKDGTVAETRKHARPEIALMIKFLWQTGIRVSEMTGIRLKDIKPAGRLCHIRIKCKGGFERWIDPSRDLVDRIKAFFQGKTYLFEHGGRPYGRTHVSQSIHRVGLAVLGKEISAHATRHSAAAHMYKETRDIEAVRIFLGHRNVATTSQYYAHATIDPEETLAIMELPSDHNTVFETDGLFTS